MIQEAKDDSSRVVESRLGAERCCALDFILPRLWDEKLGESPRRISILMNETTSISNPGI